MKHIKLFESHTINSIVNIIDEYNQFVKDLTPYIESKLGKNFAFYKLRNINNFGNKIEVSVEKYDNNNETIEMQYVFIDKKEMNNIILKINMKKYNI